jgi:integrase
MSTSASEWSTARAGFAAYLRAAGARPGTVELRMRYLCRLQASSSSGPWDLTYDELVDFVANPRWKPETRRVAQSTVRGFHRWALRSGRRSDDPALQLPPVRVPQGRPQPAPEAVVRDVLARATPRTRLMVMLAAYAGLRRSEIASLNVADVAGDELRITGKGGKVRAVPIHPVLARELEPFTAAARRSGYLFPGHDDGHLDPIAVGRTLAAALPGSWTAHKLRHRFATVAYAATHDIRAVQELLGHSKLETTQRYTAVSDDSLRRAVMAAGPTGDDDPPPVVPNRQVQAFHAENQPGEVAS